MIHHRAGSVVISQLALLVLVGASALSAQLPGRMGSPNLGGSSWQLVRFQGGNGRVLTPDIPSNYTISFGTDGRVSARIDCNRGSGSWTSQGNNDLAFGPLATTRAQCGRGSLYDKIARDWPYVRSYVIRNGHLFLSLQADAGTYEFAPLSGPVISGSAVRGTATYTERISLPNNSVFEATLEDVSRGAASSEVIARVRNEQPGNVPIPFVISYNSARINQSHSYVVRSRILVNGTVWFDTDQSYPVLTGGRGSDVQLLLRRTGPGNVLPPRGGASAASLEDTYWRLITLPNTVLPQPNTQQDRNFTLHSSNKTVSGSGGCNSISGPYTVTGDRLTFGRIMSTMRACADPIAMNAETVFLRQLPLVRRWRMTGQILELLDDSGRVLATFEAI